MNKKTNGLRHAGTMAAALVLKVTDRNDHFIEAGLRPRPTYWFYLKYKTKTIKVGVKTAQSFSVHLHIEGYLLDDQCK